MNLAESRRLLGRQQAIIRSLKPRTRGQLALIDALRAAARQVDALHASADALKLQLQASWRQLDDLQVTFANVAEEQNQPAQELEETAEIDLTGIVESLARSLCTTAEGAGSA